MTHALAGAYPDIFAAAAPCNAFNFGYYMKPADLFTPFMKGVRSKILKMYLMQRCTLMRKRLSMIIECRIFQNVGLDDTLIQTGL